MVTQNKVLKVSLNLSKHTARIHTSSGSTYLATFSKAEFEEEKHNTLNDWGQFLRYGSYSIVK